MDEPTPNDPITKRDDVVTSARKQALPGGSPDVNAGHAADGPAGIRRRLPDQIGGYSIHRLIARGGGAWVFEASQLSPPRRVAVKVLCDVMSIEGVRRFIHEGRLLARLEHPNVVRVYEVGQWHDEGVDRPFIAMEYIGAQNLVRYAADQAADVRQKLQLLIEVCSGVGHAHARGVIHRDLKPGNVIVDAEGRPRVLDFGVAKAISGETTMHTTGSQWLGTPPYMSPEQFTHDSDDIDVRCDVYALGAIGYELLSGDAPFRYEGRSVAQIIHDICEQDPARLGSIDPRFAGDVETVIAKALQKRPEDRYETVAALAADLGATLESRPITARRIGWAGILRRWARREPAAAGATVVAAILALLLAAFLLYEFVATRQIAETQRRILHANQVQTAARAFQRDDMATASRLIDAPQTPADTADLRGFVWHHLWNRLHAEERELLAHDGIVYDMAISPPIRRGS